MLSEFQLFTSTWRKTPSNHNVGSAWHELVTNSLLCKIEKSVDDLKLTYLQVTQKMKLLKSWKRADARLRSFTWM